MMADQKKNVRRKKLIRYSGSDLVFVIMNYLILAFVRKRSKIGISK